MYIFHHFALFINLSSEWALLQKSQRQRDTSMRPASQTFSSRLTTQAMNFLMTAHLMMLWCCFSKLHVFFVCFEIIWKALYKLNKLLLFILLIPKIREQEVPSYSCLLHNGIHALLRILHCFCGAKYVADRYNVGCRSMFRLGYRLRNPFWPYDCLRYVIISGIYFSITTWRRSR